MKKLLVVVVSLLANILLLGGTTAQQQCGKDVGGTVCANNLCCSEYGYCGTTEPYCGDGCQSGPCWTSSPPPPPPPPSSPSPPPPPATPSPPGGDITDLIPSSLFEKMLPYRNDIACPARGFYTYDAFIAAARSFPEFANTGNTTIRKRELAAFFAQTSHETTGGGGGWDPPGGPYAWGYCFLNELAGGDYCDSTNTQWPCAPGKQYYGRGPIQLSWNYNYGPCGEAIGEDLLNNPDLVATDPVIAFKAALWFWMTPQAPKPSCHDVMIGTWTPSAPDIAGNRLPGFGTTTNIINGGLECGMGENAQMLDRIGFYERYCSSEIFDVSPGDNLDCATQRPFAYGLLLLNTM